MNCPLCGQPVEYGPVLNTTTEPIQSAHASCFTAYCHGVRWAYENPSPTERIKHMKALEFMIAQAKFVRYPTEHLEAARLKQS